MTRALDTRWFQSGAKLAQRLSFAVVALAAMRAVADQPKQVVKDGIVYQETRQVVQRPVWETKYEPREYTVYRDQITTEMRQAERTVQVPIVENRWVPVTRNNINPFLPPTVAYELVPITRWETRTQKYTYPVQRRAIQPQKITQQVPVARQRMVEDEVISRVALGPAGGTNTSILASAAPTTLAAPPAAFTPATVVAKAPATPTPMSQTATAARTPGIGGVSKYEADPLRQ